MVCGDLEGWDGAGVGGRPKRKGIYVYTLLTHFVVQQTLTQHCKDTMGGKSVRKGQGKGNENKTKTSPANSNPLCFTVPSPTKKFTLYLFFTLLHP